jgi:hypothetical protein
MSGRRVTGPIGAVAVAASVAAVAVIVVFALFGNAAAADKQPRSTPQQPLDVSMIQLIARPDDFDGEYVRVFGFFRHEFEGTALYLHREDYEQGLSKNGFWVDGDPAYSMKYVLVEGRFNAKKHGHMGLWSGEIEQVSRMDPWPPGGPRAATHPAR